MSYSNKYRQWVRAATRQTLINMSTDIYELLLRPGRARVIAIKIATAHNNPKK